MAKRIAAVILDWRSTLRYFALLTLQSPAIARSHSPTHDNRS
jgi:hypothetical protein